MAKLTLLKMVQNILSSMDSDDVATVTDTVEAQQVADIIEETYYEILDRREWEFLKHRVRQLDDNASPNTIILDIPTDVMHVETVRYNDFNTSKLVDIKYVSPIEFLDKTQRRDQALSTIDTVTIADGVDVGIKNDSLKPNFWTSFDEAIITFDAYSKVDEATGVTGANSAILAEVRPVYTQSDSFIADMPERMFTLFLHEAKSTCWLQIKQLANPKSEQIARRQHIRLRELERRTVKDQEVVNYGRIKNIGRNNRSREGNICFGCS